MVNSPNISTSSNKPPNGSAKKGSPASFGGTMRRIGKYFTNRIQLFTASDWVMIVLWVLTFIMIFVFIGVDAAKTLTGNDHVTGVAVTAAIFVLFLCSAIVTMVIVKFLRLRQESGKV